MKKLKIFLAAMSLLVCSSLTTYAMQGSTQYKNYSENSDLAKRSEKFEKYEEIISNKIEKKIQEKTNNSNVDKKELSKALNQAALDAAFEFILTGEVGDSEINLSPNQKLKVRVNKTPNNGFDFDYNIVENNYIKNENVSSSPYSYTNTKTTPTGESYSTSIRESYYTRTKNEYNDFPLEESQKNRYQNNNYYDNDFNNFGYNKTNYPPSEMYTNIQNPDYDISQEPQNYDSDYGMVNYSMYNVRPKNFEKYGFNDYNVILKNDFSMFATRPENYMSNYEENREMNNRNNNYYDAAGGYYEENREMNSSNFSIFEENNNNNNNYINNNNSYYDDYNFYKKNQNMNNNYFFNKNDILNDFENYEEYYEILQNNNNNISTLDESKDYENSNMNSSNIYSEYDSFYDFKAWDANKSILKSKKGAAYLTNEEIGELAAAAPFILENKDDVNNLNERYGRYDENGDAYDLVLRQYEEEKNIYNSWEEAKRLDALFIEEDKNNNNNFLNNYNNDFLNNNNNNFFNNNNNDFLNNNNNNFLNNYNNDFLNNNNNNFLNNYNNDFLNNNNNNFFNNNNNFLDNVYFSNNNNNFFNNNNNFLDNVYFSNNNNLLNNNNNNFLDNVYFSNNNNLLNDNNNNFFNNNNFLNNYNNDFNNNNREPFMDYEIKNPELEETTDIQFKERVYFDNLGNMVRSERVYDEEKNNEKINLNDNDNILIYEGNNENKNNLEIFDLKDFKKIDNNGNNDLNLTNLEDFKDQDILGGNFEIEENKEDLSLLDDLKTLENKSNTQNNNIEPLSSEGMAEMRIKYYNK